MRTTDLEARKAEDRAGVLAEREMARRVIAERQAAGLPVHEVEVMRDGDEMLVRVNGGPAERRRWR